MVGDHGLRMGGRAGAVVSLPERGALPFLFVSDLLAAIKDGRIVPVKLAVREKRIEPRPNPFDAIKKMLTK